jgi:hypothetical protein
MMTIAISKFLSNVILLTFPYSKKRERTMSKCRFGQFREQRPFELEDASQPASSSPAESSVYTYVKCATAAPEQTPTSASIFSLLYLS